MISEVVMPQMGADMTEGTLIRWLKNEGDAAARGEVIAEIETDKANVEIEAFDGGVFRAALAMRGCRAGRRRDRRRRRRRRRYLEVRAVERSSAGCRGQQTALKASLRQTANSKAARSMYRRPLASERT
jgi:hypothetical protein